MIEEFPSSITVSKDGGGDKSCCHGGIKGGRLKGGVHGDIAVHTFHP